MSIEQWNNRSSFLLGADLVYSPLFEINSEGAFLFFHSTIALFSQDFDKKNILKPISYFLGHLYGLGFFLSRIYWTSLDHDLMASIWEKAISILAENLNLGRVYLITAVCCPKGTTHGLFI